MSSIEFLEFTVENLVSKPDKVSITQIPGNEETIIEIRVDDDDIGKVIGKGGSVARALRTIVHAIGMKEQRNYSMEIID